MRAGNFSAGFARHLCTRRRYRANRICDRWILLRSGKRLLPRERGKPGSLTKIRSSSRFPRDVRAPLPALRRSGSSPRQTPQRAGRRSSSVPGSRSSRRAADAVRVSGPNHGAAVSGVRPTDHRVRDRTVHRDHAGLPVHAVRRDRLRTHGVLPDLCRRVLRRIRPLWGRLLRA